MDAVTRISYYFPTHALTTFWILSNLIINNASSCSHAQKQIVTALLVVYCFAVLFAAFTDTYTATNGSKFWVLIVPLYGPICFSLPTDVDKDRVWDGFYLKLRDYVHAFVSLLAFLLTSLFLNPVCMCLFPSSLHNGTARFDPAVVRTLPVVMGILLALVMVCLGTPRQMVGFGNVEETVTTPKDLGANNPIYSENPAAHAAASAKGAPSVADDSSLEGGDMQPEGYNPYYKGGSQQYPAQPPIFTRAASMQQGDGSVTVSARVREDEVGPPGGGQRATGQGYPTGSDRAAGREGNYRIGGTGTAAAVLPLAAQQEHQGRRGPMPPSAPRNTSFREDARARREEEV